MTVLLESLADGLSGDDPRRAVLDAVLRDGLPSTKVEAWKYTSLRTLGQRAFAAASNTAPTSIDSDLVAAIPTPRLVFVNGRRDAQLSCLQDLPAGVRLDRPADAPHADVLQEYRQIATEDACPEAAFTRLNAAFARDGLRLHVAAGVQVERAVHVAFIGAPAASDLAWHLRHRIELEPGAALTLVEHHLASDDHAHLDNTHTLVQLATDAHLQHVRIQHAARSASLITRTDATLDERACYRRIDLELGAGLSRHELSVRLHGTGAGLQSRGVLLADDNRHLDTRLDIVHVARDSACDVLWRGLAGDRGRAVFHGGITIRPGADGSDARLSSKNLLLNPGAEIDAQPVLEIHADEVKAAHGATVGQLDETALFYLRSRGLPEAQARALLTAAFCRVALDGIDDPDLRGLAAQALESVLAIVEQRA